MTTVYIADLDTEHFSFRGVGLTKGKAMAALEGAWEAHRAAGAKHGITVIPFKASGECVKNKYTIDVSVLEVGHGYRDGVDIYKPVSEK